MLGPDLEPGRHLGGGRPLEALGPVVALAPAAAWVIGNGIEVIRKGTITRPPLYREADGIPVHVDAFDDSFPSGHMMRGIIVAYTLGSSSPAPRRGSGSGPPRRSGARARVGAHSATWSAVLSSVDPARGHAVAPRAEARVERELTALAAVERGELGDPLTIVAYLAGPAVELPEGELNEARRRALLLLAAGGDPHRELGVDDRAVKSLAVDLFTEERRAQLAAGLDELAVVARDLPRARDAVLFLAADLDLAWRLFALGLLAEELVASGG